jgi:hypothetical protein
VFAGKSTFSSWQLIMKNKLRKEQRINLAVCGLRFAVCGLRFVNIKQICFWI